MKENLGMILTGLAFTVIGNIVLAFYDINDNVLAILGGLFILIAIFLGIVHRNKKKRLESESINNKDEMFL